jgi:uncharacterized protein involved in exopolysaccharide biosynthesis
MSGPDLQNENHEIIDWAQIRDYLGFFVRSTKRHKLMLLLLTGLFAGIGVAAVAVLPKSYRVETKVLATRSQALAVRGDSNMGTEPYRGAAETILRRDNLESLVKQIDLVHSWYHHRAPLGRFLDWARKAIAREETDEEKISWMADMLEKELVVWSTPEGTVVIQVNFPDALLAFQLAEAAQQNFLESRHATEVSAITESVSILRRHGLSLREDIDSAVDAIQKLQAERHVAIRRSSPISRMGRSHSSVTTAAVEADPALLALKLQMDSKQRVLADLEDSRRRRVTDLQAKLAEQKVIFTANHPTIVDLEQSIASLSGESPQMTAVRKELAALRAEYAEKSAPKPGEEAADKLKAVASSAAALNAPAPQIPTDIIRMNEDATGEHDPEMMLAQGRLKDAMDKYAGLRGQIEAAQIELETAQAAFKYRYSVISPPQIPRSPMKPKPPIVIAAAAIAGLLLGMFLSIVRDLRKGKIIEKWQVERVLGLPVLGEIKLPKLTSYDGE